LTETPLEELRLCVQCIGEKYLRAKVQVAGEVAACSYCGTTAPSQTLEELAPRFEQMFEQHYVQREMPEDDDDYDGEGGHLDYTRADAKFFLSLTAAILAR
jgi:NMD protein affecting ribosome stability and mRNA decay